MTYSLTSREETDPKLWDSLVDDCDQAWFWHLYHPQAAKAARKNRTDLSFAVSEKADLLAVVPLHLISGRKNFIPWSVLETSIPAIPEELSTNIKTELLSYINQEIKRIAGEHRALYTEMSLPVLAPAFRGEKNIKKDPLASMGYESRASQTWVIDLRVGLEQLWAKLEKRARYAVRKAQKDGVTIREAAGSEDLETYYELHQETYGRTGATAHPKRYFEAIWEYFLDRGYAKIFFAEHNGIAIAAENFTFYKGSANYHTGASNSAGLKLNANTAIQWHAIEWMVSNDLQWYDVGEAFPDSQGKRGRLSKFKRSLGGELYPLYRGRRFGFPLLSRVETLFTKMPR